MKRVTPKPPIKCNCRGLQCRGRRYLCRQCRRSVPWCFGAHDADPGSCDNCVAGVR